MQKIEFMEGIHLLQNAYNQTFSKEKLQIWWEQFKDLSKNEYIVSIKKIVSKNRYMPNIAEIRCEMMDNQDFNNYNINSCYWYINERIWCEKNNISYYDITKGPNYPLSPFK